MTNFEQFVENVKAGHVKGLGVNSFGALICGSFTIKGKPDGWRADHLCAHIRRWLGDPKGHKCDVKLHVAQDLEVMNNYGDIGFWTEGSELDWHIDAANWIIAREVEK